MRLLYADTDATETPGRLVGRAGERVDDAALERLYAAPPGPWLRVNFVSTLDGAAAGDDGRTGSINTAADGVVFRLLRRLCDVVLVGAGTARAEGYRRPRPDGGRAPALAVVSHSGLVPEALREGDPGSGQVLLVTRSGAPTAHLAHSREVLGPDAVLLCGDERVDLRAARGTLEERGLVHVLSEGGPTLMHGLLEAGVVDELDLTWSPLVVGGDAPRIVGGGPLRLELEPMTLLESDGTLIGRWRVRREPRS